MSSPQGRKPKSESYAYSWFLPAEGHNGSAVVSQLPPSELEAKGEEGKNSEVAAMEARTERWRHSGEHRSKNHLAGSSSFDLRKVRLIGLVAWGAVAASGAFLLAARASQSSSTQLGILGAVWLGVSAAIWFVPGFLSRGAKS